MRPPGYRSVFNPSILQNTGIGAEDEAVLIKVLKKWARLTANTERSVHFDADQGPIFVDDDFLVIALADKKNLK